MGVVDVGYRPSRQRRLRIDVGYDSNENDHTFSKYLFCTIKQRVISNISVNGVLLWLILQDCFKNTNFMVSTDWLIAAICWVVGKTTTRDRFTEEIWLPLRFLLYYILNSANPLKYNNSTTSTSWIGSKKFQSRFEHIERIARRNELLPKFAPLQQSEVWIRLCLDDSQN